MQHHRATKLIDQSGGGGCRCGICARRRDRSDIRANTDAGRDSCRIDHLLFAKRRVHNEVADRPAKVRMRDGRSVAWRRPTRRDDLCAPCSAGRPIWCSVSVLGRGQRVVVGVALQETTGDRGLTPMLRLGCRKPWVAQLASALPAPERRPVASGQIPARRTRSRGRPSACPAGWTSHGTHPLLSESFFRRPGRCALARRPGRFSPQGGEPRNLQT